MNWASIIRELLRSFIVYQAVVTSGQRPIERLSPMDLTMLATDRGSVPMNISAVLEFGPAHGPSSTEVRSLLGERLPAIPRLRQRSRPTPLGCGRPIWVDDADFDLERHLTERNWPAPGTRRELFDVAAELVCDRLDKNRPLWRACVVTHAASGRVALVLVFHHVLADGLGGLAVLAALADPGPRHFDRDFPRRAPRWDELAINATRLRLNGVRGLVKVLRRGVAGIRELGIGHTGPRLVEKTFLNRPTSPRRRLDAVALPLADVVALAHRVGGTVNDVVLAAVTGALFKVLAARGEHPARLVVSVPVSGRRSTTTDRLGNDTGVRPIAVAALADDHARLAKIITLTRSDAALQRASSAVPLGLAFRGLSRLGLFRLFIEHQRLVNTFQTNLRGPAEPVFFGGYPIGAIVPAAVNPGNVGVSFDVFSYAGVLGVTVVTDPEIVTEPDRIEAALTGVFASLLEP
jgi:diacylglycerol O-acyltransferase / wax synthase